MVIVFSINTNTLMKFAGYVAEFSVGLCVNLVGKNLQIEFILRGVF